MVVESEVVKTILDYIQLNLDEELNYVPRDQVERIRKAVEELSRAYLHAEPL